MGTISEPPSNEDRTDLLHKHMSGDEHSTRGFQYECALRCLWLLDLRGTDDRLSVADGEDAKITHLDGSTTYRQAKKKENGHWVYSGKLKEFIERAYLRFGEDPSVRHEFYTNQAFSTQKPGVCDGERLNASHARVHASAPTNTELFCKSIRLFTAYGQPDSFVMRLLVNERLRKAIDSAYPGCQARNFVTDQEVDELAAKLLMCEYGLLSRGVSVVWHEIDAELGLDSLISDLYFRSMANGTLIPFDQWPTVDQGGPDDEKTRAVEAARAGRILDRPKVDNKVWAYIDAWWAGIKKRNKPQHAEYLVVVLFGKHGTGKTWSLVRIGNQIPARYRGMHVCIAAASPPDRPFTFSNLAISQPGPCTILIDDFFPNWSGLVSGITAPPSLPVLILGTAARTVDDNDMQRLTQRLGRRVKVVELPDYLDDSELDGLGRTRGLSLSVTERNCAKTTNIRQVARILSGIPAPDYLSGLLPLLSRTETLDILGPILMCTGLRVAVPKELMERRTGRSLPSALQPWTLGYRGAAGKLVALEDPSDAAVLLTKALGAARDQRMQTWCEQLLRHVDPAQARERAFTRHLFRRLAQHDTELCNVLLVSCRSTLNAVMTREPLWALIFSWLPVLAGSGRENLLKYALSRVTAAPRTTAEIAVLVEAYGTPFARRHLGSLLLQLAPWNPELLARFVEAVMVLPRDERRGMARQVTSLLIDLPMYAFVETLCKRSCYQEATRLAFEHGRADDRRAFLYRLGVIIKRRLATGETLSQSWFEASRLLTNRIISQGRHGLSIQIIQQMFIGGDMDFKAEERYKTCFENEQALVHRPLINLGLKLLKDKDLESLHAWPPVTGSFVAFASSWAGEEDWLKVADAFAEFLESLAAKEVPFDRLSPAVIPTLRGIHRGPRYIIERFLKTIICWITDERGPVTVESSQLLLHAMSIVAAQSWINNQVYSMTAEALMALARRSSSVEETLEALFRELRAVLGMPAKSAQRALMFNDWIDCSSLVGTFLRHVGRIRWDKQERTELANHLIRLWQGMAEHRHSLTQALLRLEDLENAQRFAEEMAKNDPSNPSPLGYMAILSAKRGDATVAEDYLAAVECTRAKYGRGLHPYIAHWAHSELARVTEERRRTLHLLCAELASDRSLRPYDDVVNQVGDWRYSLT